MRCLVADDDPLVCATVEEFLSRIEGIEFCVQAHDGVTALNLISTGGFDAVFLDLQMPGLDGESLLRAMPKGIPVVVVSASTEFGARSYDFDIADYLVKPLEFSRFFQAVKKLRERRETEKPRSRASPASGPGSASAPATGQMSGAETNEIFLKDGTRIRRIDLKRLLFVKAESNYVDFVTTDQSVMALMSLKKAEEMLPPDFIRIHRSYLVNKNQITSIEDGCVVIGKHKLPISQSHRDELMSRLKIVS
jgi:DNA-binding LytR/AlgR family response regulator